MIFTELPRPDFLSLVELFNHIFSWMIFLQVTSNCFQENQKRLWP